MKTITWMILLEFIMIGCARRDEIAKTPSPCFIACMKMCTHNGGVDPYCFTIYMSNCKGTIAASDDAHLWPSSCAKSTCSKLIDSEE